MENNVSEVAGMIGNLRNMACDMGNEITNQNKALTRINLKVTSLFMIALHNIHVCCINLMLIFALFQGQSNTARVTEANKRATKLLKG